MRMLITTFLQILTLFCKKFLQAVSDEMKRKFYKPAYIQPTSISIYRNVYLKINPLHMNPQSLLNKNTGVGNAMHDPTSTTKISFMKKMLHKPGLFIVALLVVNLFFASNSFGQITLVTGSPQSATSITTTLTITKPSGLALNDVMLASFVLSDNNGNTLSNVTGAGWTLVDGRDFGSNGSDHWNGTVLYKIATVADVAASSFDFTIDSDAEDGSQGTIIAFRGVAVNGGFNATGTANSGPFDFDPVTITNTNTTSITATTNTTATANAAVIMFGFIANDINVSGWQTATGPLSLTEIFDLPNNTGLDHGMGAAWNTKAATGGTGTGTATIASTRAGGLLVTLRPCTATPTITTASTPQPAAAVCFSGSSQTTTLAYTATTNSPNAYSIDWDATANTAGLTDQASTAFAFAGGGGNVTGISIPASVAAGTYNGTMFITTAAGCITSRTITLTINPSPTVNAGAAMAAICQGGTSAALGGSFGGSATSAVWTDGGAGGSFTNNLGGTPNTATYTAAVSSGSPVTLTLTTSGGSCGTTFATKNIVVNATPPTPAAGPDQTICLGTTPLAANAAAPGTGAWTILAGSPNTSTAQLSSTSNAAANFTPTLAGTYTLRWSITNGACTTIPDDIVITVNPVPTVGAGGAMAAICQGGTSAILGGSFGGAATSAIWTDGGAGGSFTNNGGLTPNTATYVASVTSSSPVVLTLTTSGGSCGTTFATKNIVVNATPPTPNAGANQNICIGVTPLAANAAAPGTGAWTILAGSPNTSTAQLSSTSNATANFTPTLAGTYTLRWSITNGACTTTPDDVVITVNALPQVSAFNGNTICSGNVGTLTATLTGATPFTVTYTPGLAEGGVVSGSPFNVVPNPGSAGAFNYTITSIQDANGCTRNSGFTDAAATINVSTPLTTISYGTNPATYCPGVAIATNAATVGGGTATSFSVSPALPAGLTLNTSTGAITGTPTVYAAATNYTVTATNACGSVNVQLNITTSIPLLSTTPGERCGTGIVALSAASNTSCFASTISWFSAVTGGSSLGTGTNFNTPGIATTTNYFAQENLLTGETTIPNSSNSNSTSRGLQFDLFEPIVLTSVDVDNTSGGGSITVGLRNNTGGAVSGASDVTLTINGSGTNTGITTIPLGWSIPAGTGYRIFYSVGSQSLQRNSSGYVFPKNLGVGLITSGIDGNATSASPTLNSGRYNYFYNWRIGRARVSTTATVNPLPTITLGANPAVDRGNTNADLLYSATTGSPDEYSITWDAAALSAGFVNVVNAALPATPIAVTVPAGADAATYNGTLTLRNTTTGCISGNNAFSVIVNKTDLTVTADDKNKIADGNVFTGFTSAITGFVNGEDETVVSGTVTYAGSAVTATAIGTYVITPVTTGLSATNYNFVAVNGSLDIEPVSQANADFRSKANGNFSAAGTWEYDLGGGNWTNASQAPTSANNVSITHDVVLDQDYTVGSSKNFALGAGAVFTVNPTRTFEVAISGAADFDGKAVTFLSDNTGTASLGQVLGSLTGATNVTVERYIPNNGFRSWRLLSVPTFGNGQTIRQAWQEGDVNPLPMDNNAAGRGTQITGVFPTQAAAAAAGFDSTSVLAGMLTWGGTNWSNVTSTNTPIANNKSYFLFIRGERSKGVTGTATNSSATTLRTNGTVYTGDQVNNIAANSFVVVPNLYPSSIDFTGLTRTGGVSNLFYVWDSKKLAGNSLGIYQTFSGTNAFNCLISGGSYVLGQPNTAIESGQGFFVQSGVNPGTITLKETAKVSGTNGNLGFRPMTPASSLVKIDTRLLGAGANNMMDANVVVFDAAYSNAVDADDALKLTNPGENIGIQKGNMVLAVEGRQPVAANDVIQFRTWNLQRQAYRLELVAANMSTLGVSAVLEDAYLQTSTPLDLSGTTSVNFSVDANAASSSVSRFRIVFRQLAPVPVNFVSITGYRTNGTVKVDWKSASERGIKDYVVERSTDGRNFTAIGNTAPASNNAIEISYSFTDAAAPSSALMYRIKSQGVNNEIKYSPVAKVSALTVKAGFVISPNPVENGIVNLQFNTQQAGKYSVRIVSTEGKTLQVRTLTHAGGSSMQNINLPATMARGTYTVEIIAPDNSKSVQTLFVNKN